MYKRQAEALQSSADELLRLNVPRGQAFGKSEFEDVLDDCTPDELSLIHIFFNMNVRNEIKAQIIRAGMTMQEVVDLLSDEYGWSDSVSNLSAKLQRESIRYKEVLELADVLGCDIVWQQRREK